MAKFELGEVLVATQGIVVTKGPRPLTFRNVSTDSREVKTGDLFLALQGPTFDGHDFVGQAVRQGARGVLVEHAKIASLGFSKPTTRGFPITVIGVKNTLNAYQELARMHRQRYSIPVVAITGSNGKTTTKELVSRVLGTRWRVLRTQGNFNNAIGVPKTLMRLHSGHQVAVIEMGVDQVGQTTRLCELARPTLGVVTNVGPDHLEFYGTMARSAASKAELLPTLPTDGWAVLNADDPYCKKFSRKTSCSVLSFGFSPQAQVRGSDLRWNGGRTSFRLWLPNRKTSVHTDIGTMGAHNVSNALAGAAVGYALGVSGVDIAAGMARFRPAPMRSEIRRWGGVTYLYDCYNANPASVKAALELLVGLDRTRRTVAVLGDMLELGLKEEQFHEEVGQQAARLGVSRVIASGNFNRAVERGVRKVGGRTQVSLVEDALEGGRVLKETVQRGDIVLIKASRGAKLERVLEAVRPGQQGT